MRKTWLLSGMIVIGSFLSAADDSLIAHLKLDEGQGDQAADSSGRGHHAKLVNTEWVEFGLEGKAVCLTGDKSYIDLGQHEDFNVTQDFTLSLWMKVGQFENHGLSLFTRGWYGKGWQTYVYKNFIAMACGALKGDSMVYYRKFVAGTNVSYPFTHVVITGKKIDEQSAAISFAIDGKVEKTYTVKGQLPAPQAPLTIGSYASNEGVNFNGIIDEVKIYNRPLTAEEIQADYQKMSQVKTVATPATADTPLPKITLPPLQKRRVAIFAPDAAFPDKAVRDIAWFEQELAKLDVQVTKLTDKELGETEILTVTRFDTLILPRRSIPFEAEYSVYQFLASGGNVITASCVPTTFKAGTDGKM